MPNRQAELRTMLQELRLPTMATACPEVALKAAKEGLSHEAFLYELARLECESQQVKPDGDEEIKRHDQAIAIRKPKKWRDVETVIGDIGCAWID